MAVTDDDAERVIQLLMKDVSETLGRSMESSIRELSALQRSLIEDAEYFPYKLVEEVQQLIHDEFVHTSWPPCPRHPNHPLWFDGEWWCCTRDNVAIARLGELRSALG